MRMGGWIAEGRRQLCHLTAQRAIGLSARPRQAAGRKLDRKCATRSLIIPANASTVIAAG
ncbi:hypothetical protein [Bosea sp. (in: a-proteobacteria)]|jgi:hypothetical protein|uniref:hypothetical protein n=1 Tax=Bosea sp. (in: a-proteobacteria) TaxID=1871050 RepID=UPI003566F389